LHEADYYKFGSNGSSWMMFVHERVVFSFIILQKYPCNNVKYVNKIEMGHDVRDTLKDMR